ncbi:MAG: hypothetical protein HY518_03095 [Candidatus Aenigmarchaeota archaeon]|nr:hypothetical protein [Candidatus Aenigmarchaeota archaeon]
MKALVAGVAMMAAGILVSTIKVTGGAGVRADVATIGRVSTSQMTRSFTPVSIALVAAGAIVVAASLLIAKRRARKGS